MGTPKISQSQLEPRSPDISEKVRVFATGKKVRKELDLSKIADVFEEMRTIILPLVPWLSKQLFTEGGLFSPSHGYLPPPAFKKKRALPLFPSHGNRSQLPDIALDRSSGAWLVITYDRDRTKREYLELQTSEELAKLFVFHADIREALFDFSLERHCGFGNLFETDLHFIVGIVLYDGIRKMVLSCFETIRREIEERERRNIIMRERVTLLADFAASLDPLTANGVSVSLPEFSIFHNHSCGSSRHTADYFSKKCLEPFFEKFQSNNSGHVGQFRVFESSGDVDSLELILRRISLCAEEIAKAQKEGKADISSVLSGPWCHTRLPFSQEEIGALKELVKTLEEIGKR